MDFPRLSTEQRNSLEKTTSKYHTALDGSPAISYLEKRGIPIDVANGFRLGYVSEPEVGHEQVEGRLAIPYLTPTGVVDIRFRAIGKDEPKYLGLGGTRVHLFNARALHEPEPYVAICEGALDAVVLSGLCGVPAVAIAGVSNWKSHFRYCFVDYEIVFVLMDPDEPGREAARKVRSELSGGTIISLNGGDVNETYLKHGRDYIRKALGL